jgi:hypothetical protein
VTATPTWRAVPGTTWIDRAPMTLRQFDLWDGQDVPTSVDRRWLWRVLHFMDVSATTATQRKAFNDLREYLRESCEHVWRYADAGYMGTPAHRQCFWCDHVEWLGGDA